MQIYLDTGALTWVIGAVSGIAVITFVVRRIRQLWAIPVGIIIGACLVAVIAVNGQSLAHNWAVLRSNDLSYLDDSGHVTHLDIRSIQGMKVGIYCELWCAAIYTFRMPDERRVELPATMHDVEYPSVPRLARSVAERAALQGPKATIFGGAPEWEWSR